MTDHGVCVGGVSGWATHKHDRSKGHSFQLHGEFVAGF
jgi:hypothetical protein